METQLHSVDPLHPDPTTIDSAAAIIRAGGLVAFPTETVYGLGANAMDGSALGRIYAAKQRPSTDPIIAHIADASQLKRLACDIPPIAHDLAQAFWPGPLTLVLKRAPDVPDAIAEGLNTVAVRMPAHPIAVALLRAAGTPIGAPSANTFTRPSATRAEHVMQDLGGRVDMILDGGDASIGLESTVLDLSGTEPVILRPGGVLLEELQRFIPGLTVAARYLDESTHSNAPGQMLKHYSPHAELRLYSGGSKDRRLAAMSAAAYHALEEGLLVGALVAEEDESAFPEGTLHVPLGSDGDTGAIGKRLFAAMRELDAAEVELIIVGDFGREALGSALWDRLLRAAEGRVIQIAEPDGQD